MKAALWIGVIVAVLVAALARRFPPLKTDEVFIANHGWNLVTGQGQRYSLYDDIFAPAVYPWRDAFAQASETLTNGWIGLWMRILGRDYWHARLGCVSAGLLAFWLLCAIADREGGPRAAWICALLLGLDPVFWLASCIVRAETILLAVSSLALWLILRLPAAFPWKRFLIGLLLGILFAAHPNALPVSMGIFVFWMIREPFSGKDLARSVTGLFCGWIVMTAFFDLSTLWMSWQTFHAQMARPPVLTWPWSPMDWLRNAFHKLFMTKTDYFSGGTARSWKTGLALRSAGWGCLFLGAIGSRMAGRRKGQPWPREMAWPAGWLVTWVSMALLVRYQAVLYSLNSYPFVLPFISLYMSENRKGSGRLESLCKGAAAAALLACPFFFARALQTDMARSPAPTEMFRQLRAYLPDPRVKIVGPNLFWYDPELSQFRDLGALTYSHWYTGGRRDAGAWLGGWRPDILITDETFVRIFLRNQASAPALSRLLGAVATPLGAIETGAGSDGTLLLYQLSWPADGA